jgi:hypothetical protein
MFALALVASGGAALLVIVGFTYITKRWKAKKQANAQALLGSGQISPLTVLDKSSGEVSDNSMVDSRPNYSDNKGVSARIRFPPSAMPLLPHCFLPVEGITVTLSVA